MEKSIQKDREINSKEVTFSSFNPSQNKICITESKVTLNYEV